MIYLAKLLRRCMLGLASSLMVMTTFFTASILDRESKVAAPIVVAPAGTVGQQKGWKIWTYPKAPIVVAPAGTVGLDTDRVTAVTPLKYHADKIARKAGLLPTDSHSF